MTTETAARLVSEPLKPIIGSRVLNSKDELLSGALSAEIRELLEKRGVLVFPRVGFTDEEQIAFTKSLGTFYIERHGHAIHKITLDGTDAEDEYREMLKATFQWHFDGFISPIPVFASLLTPKVLSDTGGQTQFCSTCAAYDALDDADKALIADLRAVHSIAYSWLAVEPQPSYAAWREWLAIGNKEHPLVWKHQSGRKSLVIGGTAFYIVGMDPVESKSLLIRLRDFATQPQFVYSHEWEMGDLVMWDNTGTLHRAIPYDPKSGRLLHRTKIAGHEPIA